MLSCSIYVRGFERFIIIIQSPLGPRTYTSYDTFCCTHTLTVGHPRHARGVVGAHAAARVGPRFALRHGRAGAKGGGCVGSSVYMCVGTDYDVEACVGSDYDMDVRR